MQKTTDHRAFLSGTAEKLLLLLMWLGLAMANQLLWVQLPLALIGFMAMALGMKNAKGKWRLLLVASSFIVAGTIGLVIEVGSQSHEALWQSYFLGQYWSITSASLLKSGVTALKALNGLMAVQFVVHCFSFHEAITLARRCWLPDYMIEMMVLSYRYLFGVRNSVQEVRRAQRQRLGYGNFRGSMQAFTSMLSTVFIKSINLSLNNYRAMNTRGYQGVIHTPEKWERSSSIHLLIILLVGLSIISLTFIL
ncbi:MAG: energy-coupling factor transporter transmembrane protein EcfT [Carboxylicivirga sp.]|jgi:cobalt/nickel transport system permease protein|nr:energy-coupling factor transporter transmembrane protein EcfT [Carboxylicivirga sp.]